MEQYRVDALSFSYPGRESRALKDLSFAVEEGEFVTICGPSGGGKSTLLRQMKTVLTPHGVRSGEIAFLGKPLQEWSNLEQARQIGYVFQSPEHQLVTDKVWHELAFGLESLGYDTPKIRLRVAEMASFFGIEHWFHRTVSELSGGQKQLLNLASVMAMEPRVLILDEPTSQLDPIAAAEFLETLARLNRELGLTVILTEHRLEEVLPHTHRLLVLEEGRLIGDGAPRQVAQQLRQKGHSMFEAMPAPLRIWAGIETELPAPLTVEEGRRFLGQYVPNHPLLEAAPKNSDTGRQIAINLDQVFFRYEKGGPDIAKGLSFTAEQGKLTAVLGGNGTGKTTLLGLIAGLVTPQRGKLALFEEACLWQESRQGRIALLPQEPQTLFLKKTLEEDLLDIAEAGSREETHALVRRLAGELGLTPLLSAHPMDLSGGELQRAALAKVLLRNPDILLLDEPTKGMDAGFKREFAQMLRSLLRQGTTVVMVSHDIEFCARYADWCALFFQGGIVSSGPPEAFFAGNSFYTTGASRMARQWLPQAVTAEDVITACGGAAETVPVRTLSLPERENRPVPKKEKEYVSKSKGIRLLGLVILLVCLAGSYLVTNVPQGLGLDHFLVRLKGTDAVWQYTAVVIVLLAGVILGAALLVRRPKEPGTVTSAERQVLPGRTRLSMGLVLLLIPLTIAVGVLFLEDRRYYFISVLVIIEAMLPFFIAFEGKRPQAKMLVVLAVICGLAVASRIAFAFLPQFKPVAALVIIAGIAFGAEAGFLVGAISAFLSNFYLMQGPWTPWQMFAFGIIGFLAGVLFQKGLLPRKRIPIAVFGGLATVILYGGIVDIHSMLMMFPEPTLPLLIVTYGMGLPFTLIHAAATVVFLWLVGPALLELLDRVKTKYGLAE